MMSRLLNLAFATVAIAEIVACRSAKAVTFDEQEVDQNQFIAVATPLSDRQYDLLIIEQIPGQQQCWSESGTKPVTVKPLMLDFDFSESCRRSTDSNGYSIRLNGQDYGLDYLLRVIERDGDLYLIGTSRSRQQPEIVIGRTYGISDGFTKIQLNSGWKFTRRVYQGKALGHIYLTSNSATVADASTTENRDQAAPNHRELEFSSPRLPVVTAQPPGLADVDSIPIEVPPPDSQLTLDATPLLPSSSPLPPPPVPQSLPTPSDSESSEPSPGQPIDISVTAPEPVPPSATTPSRRSLSDILQVAPRVYDKPGELRGTRLPVPQPPPRADVRQSGETFKVLVQASSAQAAKVRSLYPDAFSTTYNGRAMMQIGVFSNRERVDKVLQSLESLGLTGTVLSQ